MAVLVGLLVAALWYYVAIWRATPSVPVYRNIIVDVAVVLALVAGCGLTALMYYNQGKGYDEQRAATGRRGSKRGHDDALSPQFCSWPGARALYLSRSRLRSPACFR